MIHDEQYSRVSHWGRLQAHVREQYRGIPTVLMHMLSPSTQEVLQQPIVRNCRTPGYRERSELAVVAELIQKNLPASANVIQNAEQQKQLDALIGRFDAAKARINEITETITSRNTRRDKLDNFIRELSRQPDLITEWDNRLWVTLVDHMTVGAGYDMIFTFKDGTEIVAG